MSSFRTRLLAPALGALAAGAAQSCLVTIDEGLIDGGGGAGANGPSSSTSTSGGQAGGGDGGGGNGAGGTEMPGPARILYTDLEGGPNSGGENDAGAFVTLYGKGFGAAQGDSSVTVGGAPVEAVRSWSDTRITCQIGRAATTGDIVVHVASEGFSNGVPFEVRTGKIYFVDPLGDDTNDGETPATPFETIPHCLSVLAPGGICYAKEVVQQLDADGAALVLPPSSQAVAPKALIAYPGSLPRIESAGTRGVLACNDMTGCDDDGEWVLGGLRIEAPARALDVAEVSGLRVVGSQVFCESTVEAGDCVALTAGASDIALLGNQIDLLAAPGGTTPAAIALSTGVSSVDIGWNAVRGPAAWTGLHVDGAGGLDVHDNIVTDVGFRGLDFAWLDQMVGQTQVTNNVVAFAGDGTDTSGCVAFAGSNGIDLIQLRHNTFYDCGSPMGANLYMAGPPLEATNNIFAQPDDTAFVRKVGFGPGLGGTHNLFAGDATQIPTLTENNLDGDPSFSAAALRDFHLLSDSAAIDSGSDTAGVTLDRDGRMRDGFPDVGAYEAE